VEKIPFFILVAIACVVTIIAQQGVVVPLDNFPLNHRILNAIVSYASYITKMVWPVNLVMHYPMIAPPVWKIMWSGLLLILISFTGICTVRRHPGLSIGWLWYIGTLVPVIGLVQVASQAMADRYTYVPSIGIFIIIAWGMPLIFNKAGMAYQHYKKAVFGASVAIIFSILMATTWLQAQHWGGNFLLYSHDLNFFYLFTGGINL
jgi:hypothetical protein